MEPADYDANYALEADNWWFVGMRRIGLDLLQRGWGNDRQPFRILDVGCGTGFELGELRSLGRRDTAARSPQDIARAAQTIHHEVVGVDVSPLALAYCRRRDERAIALARGEQLPIADAVFDAVVAFDVLEHIDDDVAALREWRRVVRPGGVLVVHTSAYEWMWSGHDVSNHHVRRYTSREVRDRLEGAGWEVDRLSYANTLLFPPIAATRLAERIRRRGHEPVAHKNTAEVGATANRLLLGALDAERRVMRHVSLPFGVSIFALAHR